MANPSVTNDTIAQTIAAEARARALYDDAGFYRNFLEQKAKKGDQTAKAELPQAQQDVERTQGELKRIQSQLARLTGANDPHARQKVAHATPENLRKYHAEKKSGVPQELKREPVRAEFVVRMEHVERPIRAAFIERILVHDITKMIDSPQLRKSLEEFLKNNPKGKKYDLKSIPASEMMRRMEILKTPTASLMEFYRTPAAGEMLQSLRKTSTN